MMKLASNSQWRATTQSPSLTQSEALPTTADVIVVGGGLSGVATAYHLSKAKKKVVLIEMASALGAGDTGQTTAHITALPDAGVALLRKNFGDAAAKIVMEENAAAIGEIEQVSARSTASCEFKRVPAVLFAPDASGVSTVEDELEALRALGAKVRSVESNDKPFNATAALELYDQAVFHPLNYLGALADEARQAGAVICLGVRYESVERSKHPHVITTSAGKIEAEELVFATHTPATMIALQTKQTPQRTYALAARVEKLPPDCLYYDTEEPYHYIRRHRHGDEDLLIVGGCDHRVGETEPSIDAMDRLEVYARERFQVSEVVYRWSGQVFEPADGLPFIGLCPGDGHIWVLTGLSGQGMTWATVGAKIVSDGIVGKQNALAAIVDPSRIKPIAQAAAFAHHNKDVSMHLVGDRLKAWVSDQGLGEGEGKVARHEGHTAALYNDGVTVHALSPVCPHAGCLVQWNGYEKSWDCPCHGSRFSAHGELLCGPAVSDLSRLE